MRLLSLVPLVALAACNGSGTVAIAPDGEEGSVGGERRVEAGFVVIAHRGASAYAPEHTFPAWDLALEMGADYLEQDLQMTAEGVLVVLHDDTLERTALECRGAVRELTLAQLAGCDVGTWFNREHPERASASFVGQPIPTLHEVLARYRERSRFYIETKSPDEAPGMEEALVEALGEHGLLDSPARARVILQSFSPESLQRLAELAPAIPRVQLVPGRWSSRRIERSLPEIALYAQGLGPRADRVDRALVDAAHSRGLFVHPYTVNDPEEIARLVALGVDGVFTDRPDRVRAHVGSAD